MKKFMGIKGTSLLLAGLALGAFDANADKLFQIKNRRTGSVDNLTGAGSLTADQKATANAALATKMNEMLDTIETNVNDNLPVKNLDGAAWLKTYANAASISSGGVGSDYSVPFNLVSVGGGVGFGADLGTNKISDLVGGFTPDTIFKVGVGAQAAVVLGLNPGYFIPETEVCEPAADGAAADAPKKCHKEAIHWGPIDTSRFRVYLSFMSFTFPATGSLTANTSEMGLHVKYKLIPEADWAIGLVKWDGVDVGVGFHRSTFKAVYKTTISQSQSATAALGAPLGDVPMTASITADLSLGVDLGVNTIPLEVSSGIRLFYFLSMYGGLGADIAFGSAKGIAEASGPLSATGDSSHNIGDVGGDVSFAMSGLSGKPNAFNLRAFGGLGIDIAIVNLYAQLNYSLLSTSAAVDLGLRVYW